MFSHTNDGIKGGTSTANIGFGIINSKDQCVGTEQSLVLPNQQLCRDR